MLCTISASHDATQFASPHARAPLMRLSFDIRLPFGCHSPLRSCGVAVWGTVLLSSGSTVGGLVSPPAAAAAATPPTTTSTPATAAATTALRAVTSPVAIAPTPA